MTTTDGLLPEGMARNILVTAIREQRCAELLDVLFSGGGVTVDRVTDSLVFIPRPEIERLTGTPVTLAAARFVADHWRQAAVENNWTTVAHPLCCVLAALDGEQDPTELGLTEDEHAAFRAALADAG